MKNRDLYLKDPGQLELVNNGVAEVSEPRTAEQLRTVRYEIETFVCEGQYAKGLERILSSYLTNLAKPEQPAAWVSGFYGSGKSHFVKMLRHLWVDFEFPDKATARGLANLPGEAPDLLRELSTAGRRLKGLHAAAGTLGAGAGESVRLTLLAIIFRSAGLPEDYAAARFVLSLRKNGFLDAVRAEIQKAGRTLERELADLYVSPVLARALLKADPTFAKSDVEVRSQIRVQFPRPSEVSNEQMIEAITEALGVDGQLPCTLVVLDEVQQWIGDNADRSYKIQEVTEPCCKHFGSRILFVGTGQTALTGTPQLQKLRDRFRIPIELSDADVEAVIRKIVLAKKPDKQPAIVEVLSTCSGEISRHLAGTKLGSKPEDLAVQVADYPLLPVRRRFWERALRAVDRAGTAGQLRTQLKIVHEAVRATAEAPLGAVVPGDFMYGQVSTDLVQTGVLLREIQELIQRLDDGSADGRLKSRLCALAFLIGRLPRDAGVDQGVRATPDILADLLVEDLPSGSAELRKRVPKLLEDLVQAGHLMRVEGEYRLQTRESSAWESLYRDRLMRLLNDEARLASERTDVLRTACGEQLKDVKVLHGKSKISRKLETHFTPDPPSPTGAGIPVWIRDGWNTDEKSVLAEVRAAGPDSPLVAVFIPRRAADELKKQLATARAAQETIDTKGSPSTDEGREARAAMESRLAGASEGLGTVLGEVLRGARVFLGGGSEKTGSTLAEAVRDAIQVALVRMYPQFDPADDPRWDKVIDRARNGAPNALEALGYSGPSEKHPVCAGVLAHVALGRKGRDIRKHFAGSPYGWPQDAVDAALMVLVGSGHLRASRDGVPLGQKQLDQGKIAVADFRVESATVTAAQRIGVRKLFQDVGVPFQPGEEAGAAPKFLEVMRTLALEAGGYPPLPASPSTLTLETIKGLVGNEQLLAIYESREELQSQATAWLQLGERAKRRLPRWDTLQRLVREAQGLPAAAEVAPQVEAIRAQRALLAEPDPVAPLCGTLAQALRAALQAAHHAYSELYQREMAQLTASDVWRRVTADQQAGILAEQGLSAVPPIRVSTEDEILASLGEISVEAWHTRRDALPERFAKARASAATLLEPKAVRVSLPSATLRTEEDLKAWLTRTETELRDHLKRGPVIL